MDVKNKAVLVDVENKTSNSWLILMCFILRQCVLMLATLATLTTTIPGQYYELMARKQDQPATSDQRLAN